MKRAYPEDALALADRLAAEDGPGAPIRLATRGHVSHATARDLLAEIAGRHPGRCISVESDAAGMIYGFVPNNVEV